MRRFTADFTLQCHDSYLHSKELICKVLIVADEGRNANRSRLFSAALVTASAPSLRSHHNASSIGSLCLKAAKDPENQAKAALFEGFAILERT